MARSKGSETPSRLRCAIYTRKSSEEGLDQDFNSLHAQREACEAYIKSQAGEGWVCLKTPYDDGGISGGTMDRPGLKTLLADIAAGKVDVVVVYKVDRLTRSLHDFARIVEVFDQKSVSFVSVTQAFNTTTSMGRLTLNVLLSFAQFEREVTGERIRDKLAQSKAKGMWMGGSPPLGYAPDGRTLKVIPEEADVVRHIFRSYLAQGTVNRLVKQLAQEGVRSKSWVTTKGRPMGDCLFTSGALYHLLRNPIFVGKIPHKGVQHRGLHPAILRQELWDQVQDRMDAAVRRHANIPEARRGKAPLTGLIFDADGVVMSPTVSQGKSGREYRYYVSQTLQKGDTVRALSGIHRLPAIAMEAWTRGLLDRVFPHLGDPLDAVERIDVLPASIDLTLAMNRLGPDASAQRSNLAQARDRLQLGEELLDGDRRGALRIHIPQRLVFRGGRCWSHCADVRASATKVDVALLQGMRRAYQMVRQDNATGQVWMDDAPASPYENRIARLAFLSPQLQRRVVLGLQPPSLTMETAKTLELPYCWDDQVSLLG